MLSPYGATSFQYFHQGYSMWPLVSHDNVDLFEVGLLLSWHTDVDVYVTLWHIIIHSFYDLFQKVRSERIIRYYIWTECNIQATVKLCNYSPQNNVAHRLMGWIGEPFNLPCHCENLTNIHKGTLLRINPPSRGQNRENSVDTSSEKHLSLWVYSVRV